jgi:hypothetical protein
MSCVLPVAGLSAVRLDHECKYLTGDIGVMLEENIMVENQTCGLQEAVIGWMGSEQTFLLSLASIKLESGLLPSTCGFDYVLNILIYRHYIVPYKS